MLDRYESADLLRFASAKDAGFDAATFADALAAIRRFGPEDWDAAGVDPAEADRLCDFVLQWSSEIRAD